MKKILALLLMACCAAVQAQTADELLNEGKNTENVTLLGTGYDLKMFSPLISSTARHKALSQCDSRTGNLWR